MDILLIAGLWLKHSTWEAVVARLEQRGHRAVAIELPGVDGGSTDATLEDQVAAVVEAIDAADRPMVVGHSAACTLAWIAADRRPEEVHSVVFIGGFPAADGEVYADFFPVIDGSMPFPGWEPFEGADSADLDEAARKALSANAVPVAGGVAEGVVRLSSAQRFDLQLLAVCPEYSPDQAKAWIDGGDVPELANAHSIAYADIDSGHWPMVTQPEALVRILDEFALS